LTLLLLVLLGTTVKAETPDPMCPGSTLERQAALAAAAPPLWQVAQKRGACLWDREKVPIISAEKTEGKG
jgi:hypothetical protein